MKQPQIYAFADEASPIIDKQIIAMRRNGLQGLEIRNVDGESVAAISLDKAREVRAKMDAAGLKVWSIGSPIGKIDIEKDDFNAHMDTLRHVIEVAKILGAENIRMFSFYIPAGKNPADYRAEVLRRLHLMADAAEGTGVTLCHENAAWKSWKPSPALRACSTRPISSSAARIPGKPGSCWAAKSSTCTSRTRSSRTTAWYPPVRATARWTRF